MIVGPRSHSRVRRNALCMIAGALLIAGCANAIISADDAVVRRDGSVALRAHVERTLTQFLRSDVKDQPVRFLLNGHHAGEMLTDRDGAAVVESPSVDAQARSYSVETTMDGKTLRDERRVFRLAPDHRVGVLIDIDGTVCQMNRASLAFKSRDTKSEPYEESAPTIHKLTQTHDVAFLTARPRALLDKTRTWVRDNEFPDIPLFGSPGLRQMKDAGDFKRGIIARAREDFPDILIGIGDLKTDRYAYRSNGMLAIIVNQPSGAGGDGVISLPNWNAVDQFFADNHEVLTDPARLRKALTAGGAFQMPSPVQ